VSARSRRLAPFAVIAGVGLTLAVLQYALDDRDPLVFTVPILVLTLVALGVLALAGRGESDGEDWEAAAAEEGLSDDGVRPLPPVTPILEGVSAPARVHSGQLFEGGPWVRVARVRGEIVAITDAPAAPIDEAAQARLRDHGRRAAVADGLLVVAVPGSSSPSELLALARELHARR
jgi:hypothetical protein